MPHVSNEVLATFNQGYEACQQRIGGGKVGVDSTCVRTLVRGSREAALRFVELHCVMASSQPGYLQSAIVVATAYQVEFQDTTLVEMVMERAQALQAHDALSSIRMATNRKELAKEPPERTAAKAWWRANDRTEAHCDECNRPLRRGEGYEITGRVAVMGDVRIDLGEEIVCETCFRSLR